MSTKTHIGDEPWRSVEHIQIKHTSGNASKYQAKGVMKEHKIDKVSNIWQKTFVQSWTKRVIIAQNSEPEIQKLI